MSTLRVSTIQDTAGSNSSTPSEIASGRAKAWVNFNGTGVVAIRAQYNVSSITDNGVGLYTVNFTTAMTDANYTVAGLSFDGGGGFFVNLGTFATTSVGVQVVRVTNIGNADTSIATVAIFR